VRIERYVSGRLSLRKRVYLLMGIGIFFPLAVLASVAVGWARSLDGRILTGRLSAAQAVAGHFDEELTQDLEQLQRLSAVVGQTMGDADLGPERRAVRAAYEGFRHRERIFLLDAEGNLLAAEPASTPPPRAAEALVEEVLRTGRPRLTGLALEAEGRLIHELVPVRDWHGNVVGVVGGTFRAERRGFETMLRHLRRGETGLAELVDGEGVVIASTVAGRAGKPAECVHSVRELVKERASTSMSCADCHAAREVKVDTTEVLTFAPLGAAPWGVLVRQKTWEALPTHGALPWYVVGGALAGQLTLALVFAWGAARSVTGPVGVLTSEAERIARGELGWPIPDLGGDEVGRLGKSLDAMREALRTLVTRVEKANAELEQRVDERTHALNLANEQLERANAELKEREEARGALLRKVISAQEAERKRIARELHDDTTQSLAVLAMGIEAAQTAMREGKTPRLDEVKAVTVHTLEEVHRIILDLRPSVLDDLGLLSAIRWYADRYLVSRGIAVRTEFGELGRKLPGEMETALFRMCQEVLSNVARHAYATRVLVQVAAEDGELRIEIEDDGRGFDPAEVAQRDARPHWGLMGIRERAEILGGTAEIDSAPGQGTRVAVRIPLPPEPGRAAVDGADARREGGASATTRRPGEVS
jgi:signal transduction histidine kinase